MKYSMAEVKKALALTDMIREDAQKNSEYAFTYNWDDFCNIMRMLTPQSSGSRMQDYMFKRLGWTRVPSNKDMGDVVNTVGQHYEVKVSVITPSNKSANVVQIRPWQKISGYHIFVIDSMCNNYLYHFALSKNEMIQELQSCGASSAHGTKESNKNNTRIEYAIRIKWDIANTVYVRWVEKYLQTGTRDIFVRLGETPLPCNDDSESPTLTFSCGVSK